MRFQSSKILPKWVSMFWKFTINSVSSNFLKYLGQLDSHNLWSIIHKEMSNGQSELAQVDANDKKWSKNSENTKIKSRVELGEEKQANQPVKKVPVELPPEPKSESGSGKWSPSYERGMSGPSFSLTKVGQNRKFSRTKSILEEHPFFVQKRNSNLFTEFPSF